LSSTFGAISVFFARGQRKPKFREIRMQAGAPDTAGLEEAKTLLDAHLGRAR
jgi:hypothetical protein